MALSMRQVHAMRGLGFLGTGGAGAVDPDVSQSDFDASMAESSSSSSSSDGRSTESRALDSFYGRGEKPAPQKSAREEVDQQERQSEPITRTVDNSTTSIVMSNLIGDRAARVSPLAQSWQFGLPPAPSRGITVRGGGVTQALMIGFGVLLTGAVVYMALKD